MSEKINHGSTVTGKARVSILNDSVDPIRKWIKKRCVSIQFGEVCLGHNNLISCFLDRVDVETGLVGRQKM